MFIQTTLQERQAKTLDDTLHNLGLIKHVKQPTHNQGHTLDLIVSKGLKISNFENCYWKLWFGNMEEKRIDDYIQIFCHIHVQTQQLQTTTKEEQPTCTIAIQMTLRCMAQSHQMTMIPSRT